MGDFVVHSRMHYVRAWLGRRGFLERKRRQRYDAFMHLCRVSPSHTILDAGSGWSGISQTLGRFNKTNPITALDLRFVQPTLQANVRLVEGDVTAMPFDEDEFDVAFCNSVIEHLNPDEQRALAKEVPRVARSFWVQTPNKYFPIEAHYMLPGFQFLPRRVRRGVDNIYTELLTRRDLQQLFPDAQIYEERVGPMVKSLAAYRPLS